MKKSSSLENKNLQRLSFEVSRTRAPLVALPPASGPPDSDSCSRMTDRDRQKASGPPIFSLREESAVPSFSFGPKDQSEASFSNESREVTPSEVSLLDNTSTQSKWLKYQNTRQCNLTTPDRVDEKVTDGFFAKAVSGMRFSNTGERENDAVNESSLDSVYLQMMKHMLQQQQQDFSSQDSVCRKKAFSLNINEASKTEEVQNMLGEYACYNCSVTGDLQVRKCPSVFLVHLFQYLSEFQQKNYQSHTGEMILVLKPVALGFFFFFFFKSFPELLLQSHFFKKFFLFIY